MCEFEQKTDAVEEFQDMRRRLGSRREGHKRLLTEELGRITRAAAGLGVQRVILFGSMLGGNTGLTSDLDLLMVWDTGLNFLERTAEVYRYLQPVVAADILVYTPAEMELMRDTPLVRQALENGRVMYEA
ncbi:MAG: nucleotidyltransferase domain-containing protein [Deltaproteobacteria bacterium]|nr:nucleotidyltransferase domain-containing protein [Deltaproteobacteria bacterium]